jgi:hypothetical protein
VAVVDDVVYGTTVVVAVVLFEVVAVVAKVVVGTTVVVVVVIFVVVVVLGTVTVTQADVGVSIQEQAVLKTLFSRICNCCMR